jgi:gluconate 2-dehydrogenase alpha chain
MAIEKTDVVIIGVGAAGGILAAELGKAGMKVTGLERGPRLTTEDFMPHDELRFFQRQDLRPNVKRQPVTWRPNANSRADRLPTLAYGNQAGGGSVHYGAVSWRLHEDDFRARSHTIEHYGASVIPQDSSLADWPLSYADLEPYYDRAEYELGVSGKAGNVQGNKIDGGNVFEAPRRRDYPLPPLRDDQSGVIFHSAAEKLGYHPFPTPRAILSQDYNGRPGCTYCGFCQAFGCHVGAKSSILVTKLPEADATGNFRLITGAMCYRVNSDNSGRVTGVSYYGRGGSDNTIEAELVILSPFIYDNTRLLLLRRRTNSLMASPIPAARSGNT